MLALGRSRTRRRPIVAVESASSGDLTRAINNLELAERRLTDGRLDPLRESTSELEQRLYDPGWRRFTVEVEQEFTDDGRRQMRSVCRLMSIVNPLLVRGVGLRSAYIHSGGVQRTARANGKDDANEQDVQAVVAAFLTDEGNARSFTSPAARDRLEHSLATDGELFVALITRPLTGEVQTRVILADEIADIICNPEDRTEHWYYKRCWTERQYAKDGTPTDVPQEMLYPAVDYRPARRFRQFAGMPVAWDKPVLHIAVNRPEHWLHGIPDVYSAINWARAYKTFLEQWATVMAALSKYAWRTTAAGSKQAKQIRSAVTAANPYRPETAGPGDLGQMVVTAADQTLEAIPKSGATIDAESGRPLAMMAAAALGIPVTMLLSDPGQTGARAVAETLDQPTELTMNQRREVWTAADDRILRYVIAEAVRAPKGPLKGRITRDRFRDREVVELDGDTDPTVDIVWPDLSDTTVKEKIDAIVSAAGTGTLPPELVLRLVLAAIGVRNADAIIAEMVKDGVFLWPSTGPAPGATTGVIPSDGTVDGQGLPAGAGMPDQNPAQPGQLAAAAVEHAASGAWSALDADAASLAAAAQADAVPAGDLPAWWADADAVDDDWRVDAALARGADIAEAYGSQHAGDDEDALRRGYDILTAEAQLTGGQAPTFEVFAAAARAAGEYTPTVQIDNRVVATAVRVGSYAATVGDPITTCPYQGADPGQAALRRVWLSAYLRIRPAGPAVARDAAASSDAESPASTEDAGDGRG